MASPRRRLIVVSNRGPVTFARDATGARVTRRGAGGLVTALGSLVAHHDVTWIASALSDEDRVVADESRGPLETTVRGGARCGLHLVTHEPATYDHYYNVLANPTLWFLQHELLELLHDRGAAVADAWDHGYVPVNRAFADAVVEELDRQPDAAVFVQDYHLYLVPRLVRSARPDALLAHFTHIPWPSRDRWRALPGGIAHAIHDGLAACDVAGFHTARWAEAFRASAEELLGREALDETAVVARPISVDVAEFEALARSDEVLEAERRLVADRPERLVLRVDRTDPSKNVVRGVRAFELLLERSPRLHGRVSMRALLDPSRQKIPEYVEYLDAIEREVARVNARFSRPGWVPVDLRVEDDFSASVAAYKQFDVLLVNAVRDGLNLVAKEAPLVNERDGVVVLSRDAGAYEELQAWVTGVDPYDVEGQADALREALELDPDERRRRRDGIAAWVRGHDLERWLDDLVADFDEAGARRRALSPPSAR